MPRKKIDINLELIESLCAILCTLQEIAEIVGTQPDKFVRAFKKFSGEDWSEFYKRKTSQGKSSLRRAMYNSAIKGNVTAQIFLAKNVLGMKNDPEIVDPNDMPGQTVTMMEVLEVLHDPEKNPKAGKSTEEKQADFEKMFKSEYDDLDLPIVDGRIVRSAGDDIRIRRSTDEA